MVQDITVIFPTCNRYQMARMVAARKLLLATIVEISGVGTYNIPGWRSPDADGAEYVETIFPDKSFSDIAIPEMCNRLWAHLSARRDQIQLLAVLGWSNPEAVAGIAWAINNGVAIIVLSESQAIDESRIVWKEFIKQRISKLYSAGVVGGGPHVDYLAQLGMPRDRIFVGYDAVDNQYFREASEAARVRGAINPQVDGSSVRLGLSSAPFFLASARFIEKKNLLFLIRAYARYREFAVGVVSGQEGSEVWDLVLLGDGPLRGEMEAMSRALGVAEWIHMPGFKPYPDLPAYYGFASAFVHASTTEQWGLVVNEAMACGLPVIVSYRVGCARDLVKDGVNGYTFDPCDVEQLAQHMLRISASDFPLSTFGAASLSIIADWGPARFATGLKAAVEKALEVGPQRASLLDRLILKALMLR